MTSDLGILYLEHNAVLTNNVNMICLPTNKPVKGKSITVKDPLVAGWGNLAENESASRVLQVVSIPLVDNTICRNVLQKQHLIHSKKQISDSVLCAGEEFHLSYDSKINFHLTHCF